MKNIVEELVGGTKIKEIMKIVYELQISYAIRANEHIVYGLPNRVHDYTDDKSADCEDFKEALSHNIV